MWVGYKPCPPILKVHVDFGLHSNLSYREGRDQWRCKCVKKKPLPWYEANVLFHWVGLVLFCPWLIRHHRKLQPIISTLNLIFSVITYLMHSYGNFSDNEQVNKYCHGWWMSSSISQKKYFFLLTTWDEILSWMIERLIKNHFVIDSNCNTVNL